MCYLNIWVLRKAFRESFLALLDSQLGRCFCLFLAVMCLASSLVRPSARISCLSLPTMSSRNRCWLLSGARALIIIAFGPDLRGWSLFSSLLSPIRSKLRRASSRALGISFCLPAPSSGRWLGLSCWPTLQMEPPGLSPAGDWDEVASTSDIFVIHSELGVEL